MTLWTVVPPVVTLLLGWTGSTLAERHRYRRGAERARRERLAKRREAASEQRRQFELTTLSDTYGALSSLARAAARVHLLGLTVARINGTYGSHQIDDDELHEEHRLAALEVTRLAELVLDDEIRRMVTDAHDVVIRVPTGQKTLAKAEAEFDHAFKQLDAALSACAGQIRDLYQSRAS